MKNYKRCFICKKKIKGYPVVFESYNFCNNSYACINKFNNDFINGNVNRLENYNHEFKTKIQTSEITLDMSIRATQNIEPIIWSFRTDKINCSNDLWKKFNLKKGGQIK